VSATRESFYAPSHPVLVLRANDAPMDLRQITRASAKIGGGDRYYDHIDASLCGAERRGEVRRVGDADDYREQRWEAA